MTRRALTIALVAIAVIYSIVHFVMSGVVFALRTPNVGQVVEELQPLYRLFTAGAATVDHPRQYGPIFLMLFHPVYKLDLVDHTLLSRYAYALDLIAILIGFLATFDAIRTWAATKGVRVGGTMLLALGLLWANFSPLYGVLVIKNVELWELALVAVAGAALLRDKAWLAGWSIAAAALVKMLPLVFIPYLLLRHRRAFAHSLIAFAVILTISQLMYDTAMGYGYLPAIVKAAVGNDGFGNPLGLIWHENVSLRGVALKAFGYLEKPDYTIINPVYSRGFYVRPVPEWQQVARTVALGVEAIGALWVAFTLLRRTRVNEPVRTFWDLALVGLMMLVLAPQISQDYMVLTLGAFSFVLAGCMLFGTTARWTEFAIAVLLVGNVVPRGLFSRVIDPLVAITGYEHLTRSEAYQYFGFPLLGLLVLARAWHGLSKADDSAPAKTGNRLVYTV
jgi:hypothetical protein